MPSYITTCVIVVNYKDVWLYHFIESDIESYNDKDTDIDTGTDNNTNTNMLHRL